MNNPHQNHQLPPKIVLFKILFLTAFRLQELTFSKAMNLPSPGSGPPPLPANEATLSLVSAAVWFMEGHRMRESSFVTPAFPGETWRIKGP